jgi:hypothetical protein
MEDIAVMLKDNGLEKVNVDALSLCCSSTQEEQAVKIPMFLASAQKQD